MAGVSSFTGTLIGPILGRSGWRANEIVGGRIEISGLDAHEILIARESSRREIAATDALAEENES